LHWFHLQGQINSGTVAANNVPRESGRGGTMTEACDGLTPRQWEVAQLVAQGLSNPEIAERLFLSRSTVESHVHTILEKRHFRHRAEIAAWVVRSSHQDQ